MTPISELNAARALLRRVKPGGDSLSTPELVRLISIVRTEERQACIQELGVLASNACGTLHEGINCCIEVLERKA